MSQRQASTSRDPDSSPTSALVSHIVGAIGRPLPDRVVRSACHHILDTVAAVVSGRMLPAGIAGADFVTKQGLSGASTVIGIGSSAPAGLAALANAMAAHADESDDTHELSKSHPGCSIVPTALAVAEDLGSTGEEVVRAVTLGYDIGCRMNMALWPVFADVRKQRWGTPGISGMFGSASATMALKGLDEQRVRYALSYVAQQVSGMNTWKRDVDHVEKAYVLAGWPAYAALFAISLIEHGWTGVDDVFTGDPNFLEIVGKGPDPDRLVDELGTRFEIERTHIKLHSVGSPAQAPIQALTQIIQSHSLADQDIEGVLVTIPSVLAHTVQRAREMPNINLQYLLSTVVADGTFSFGAAHDEARFSAWRLGGADERIEVVADESMEPRRQALVEVKTVAGQRLSNRVEIVRGSSDNPLSEDEVRHKAMGLMVPLLGSERSQLICDTVLELPALTDVNKLTDLLRLSAPGPSR